MDCRTVDCNNTPTSSHFYQIEPSPKLRLKTTSMGDYEYQYNHGRRFQGQGEGAYYMPNDESEISRLDMQHQIWLLTLDDHLCRAPIASEIETVLEVGAGSGIWALDFAGRYPNCQVLGVDLVPVKPTRPVPTNCSFRIHNVETDNWENFAPRGSIDLVHSRFLIQGMHDWRGYFQHCYNCLKPGGWLEAQEVRYPMHSAASDVPPDTPYLRWGRLVYEALAKGGINAGAPQEFSRLLKDVGFEDVVEEEIWWPVGTWPDDEKGKKMGEMQFTNYVDGLEGYTMGSLTKHLGWTTEQVTRLVKEVLKDLEDLSKKYYLVM
ncbi:MAG: hypothetical protein Q9219_007544 [cf. Caloplaca sp. 3 TL-2023]